MKLKKSFKSNLCLALAGMMLFSSAYANPSPQTGGNNKSKSTYAAIVEVVVGVLGMMTVSACGKSDGDASTSSTLSNSFNYKLISEGLTESQASTITSSASASASSASRGALKTHAAADVSADAQNLAIITEKFVDGAIKGLGMEGAGAPTDAAKVEMIAKIEEALTGAVIEVAGNMDPTNKDANVAVFASMIGTQSMTSAADPLTGITTPANIALAAVSVGKAFTSGLGNQAISAEQIGPCTAAFSKGAMTATPPSTFTTAQTAAWLQGPVQGVVSGYSVLTGFNAEAISAATASVTAAATYAIVNNPANTAAMMQSYVASVGAGPVAAMKDFPNFTAAEQKDFANKCTKGATTGMVGAPLTAAQTATFTDAITGGATAAMSGVIPVADMANFIGGISAGPVAALASFTDAKYTDAFKSSMTQGATSGPTRGMAAVAGVTAANVAAFTLAASTAAVAAMNGVIPAASLATYVSAASAGPVSAMTYFPSYSSAELGKMAQYAAQGGTAGLAAMVLTATQMNTMTQAVTTGCTSAIPSTYTPTQMTTFVGGIGKGPADAMNGAGFTGFTDAQLLAMATAAATGASAGLGNVSGLTAANIQAMGTAFTSAMTGQMVTSGAVPASYATTMTTGISQGSLAGMVGAAGMTATQAAAYAVTMSAAVATNTGYTPTSLNTYTPPSTCTSCAATAYVPPTMTCGTATWMQDGKTCHSDSANHCSPICL